MKTALNQAIEEIKAKPRIDKAEALAILYAYLPTGQEQLEQAYKDGLVKMYGHSRLNETPADKWQKEIDKDVNSYYTETFKTDK